MHRQPPIAAAASSQPRMMGVGPFDPSSCQTLYLGHLHTHLPEAFIQNAIVHMGFRVLEIKIIKDKVSGLSAGYGFVKFADHGSAALAMQRLTGEIWFNQEVRVGWAVQKDQMKEDNSAHHSIFVGDLSNDVNDRALFEAFQACDGCSNARVMWDHATNRSKGYGFVSFKTQELADAAIEAMNGKLIGHRRTRCGPAQHKQTGQTLDPNSIDRADPQNCNVYVGNVSLDVTDAQLRQAFERYGTITDVKIYRQGSYGFVSYAKHEEAVNAIVAQNGQILGEKPLKCSWGRHQPRQNAVSQVNLVHMQQLMAAQALQQSMLGPSLMPGGLQGGLQGGMGSGQGMLNPSLLPQHAQQAAQLPPLLLPQQGMPMNTQQLGTPQQPTLQQLLQGGQIDPAYYGMYYRGP